jgi:DNA-binding FrmR family transcriptional regulator
MISPVGGYMAYRPKSTDERILHRLKIARGHLNKVISMMEEDAYCIDVMHQMQAIESGLKETGNLLLENHLKTCVADAIGKGKKDEAIAEIMQVFKKK